MQPLTAEWVEKAEGDYLTLMREMRARKKHNYDGACFHAQQCAEKYMKALLQESGRPFPKSPDLDDLMKLLLPIDAAWALLQSDLQKLTLYAVRIRYPGDQADKPTAKAALQMCRAVRDRARLHLGLPITQATT